jgi:hypothetical protein
MGNVLQASPPQDELPILCGGHREEARFADVANMTGGFTAWKDAGLQSADHHPGP